MTKIERLQFNIITETLECYLDDTPDEESSEETISTDGSEETWTSGSNTTSSLLGNESGSLISSNAAQLDSYIHERVERAIETIIETYTTNLPEELDVSQLEPYVIDSLGLFIRKVHKRDKQSDNAKLRHFKLALTTQTVKRAVDCIKEGGSESTKTKKYIRSWVYGGSPLPKVAEQISAQLETRWNQMRKHFITECGGLLLPISSSLGLYIGTDKAFFNQNQDDNNAGKVGIGINGLLLLASVSAIFCRCCCPPKPDPLEEK